MSQDDATYKEWFRDLLRELSRLPDDERFLGRGVRRLQKGVPTIQEWVPSGAGWWSEVAAIGSRGTLELWYDRYLDREGDLHLGVWVNCGPRVGKRAADTLGVEHRYTWSDRDEFGFLRLAHGRAERRRIGRYFLDEWGAGSGTWVGGYVRASPHTMPATDAVGAVLTAMGRLAAAFAPEVPARPPAPPPARYWESVSRLARQQAKFRAELIVRHGAVCMISGCRESVAIDAAHIRPVADGGHETPNNGLLLRADLHRLFDAGLITITGDEQPRVLVARELGDEYQAFRGHKVRGLEMEQRVALRERNGTWESDHWQ